jgi:hypothetical protein
MKELNKLEVQFVSGGERGDDSYDLSFVGNALAAGAAVFILAVVGKRGVSSAIFLGASLAVVKLIDSPSLPTEASKPEAAIQNILI